MSFASANWWQASMSQEELENEKKQEEEMKKQHITNNQIKE